MMVLSEHVVINCK